MSYNNKNSIHKEEEKMSKKSKIPVVGEKPGLTKTKTVFVFGTGNTEDAYPWYRNSLKNAGFQFAEEMEDVTLIILLGGAAHLDRFPSGMARKTVIVPSTKNNMSKFSWCRRRVLRGEKITRPGISS